MTAIVAAIVLTAAALSLNAWLLRFEPAAGVLTPEPERVVQSFVGTVIARRPGAAEAYLAEDLRESSASADRLRSIGTELRARHGAVRFEDADTRRDGETAEVRVRLATTRDGVIERPFRLTRDPHSRLWKIADFHLTD